MTEDIDSGVCSALKFYLQDYEIMTGIDFLLNLPFMPLGIVLQDKIAIINMGHKIIAWAKNITQDIVLP